MMDMSKLLSQLRIINENPSIYATMSEDDVDSADTDKDSTANTDDANTDDAPNDKNDRGVDDGVDSDTNKNDVKAQDDKYYNAIKSGGKIPEEVVEPDRFLRYYEKTYNVQENINIQLDQGDAYKYINRMAELAGTSMPITAQIEMKPEEVVTQVDEPTPNDNQAYTTIGMESEGSGDGEEDEMLHFDNHCPHCGAEKGMCLCPDDDDEGYENQAGIDQLDHLALEDINNDFGHVDHSDSGDEVDRNTYLWKAPNGAQRITRGPGGDNSLIPDAQEDDSLGISNPLIKEHANALFVKFAKEYKSYIAEADLAASNVTGAESPFTATDRDNFDKDPFAGDTEVTDGSRSPLSTIKRQDVLKEGLGNQQAVVKFLKSLPGFKNTSSNKVGTTFYHFKNGKKARTELSGPDRVVLVGDTVLTSKKSIKDMLS